VTVGHKLNNVKSLVSIFFLISVIFFYFIMFFFVVLGRCKLNHLTNVIQIRDLYSDTILNHNLS